MANNSGFYNVSRIKTKNKKKHKLMWQYQINNRMIKDVIKAPSLQLLKIRVLDKGYLWGIIDLEKAEKSAKQSNVHIKYLVGKYGIQLKDKQ